MGNTEIAELLKKHGALELGLHQAAAEGNIEQVRANISRGGRLNAEDQWQQTPLMYAKVNGHTEVVDLLRKHGAEE